MARLLVRVEGVNFENSVLDTQDLSTIRGGSLALLGVDQPTKSAIAGIRGKADSQSADAESAELVFSGASQCAFIFQHDGGEGVRDDLAEKFKVALVERSQEQPPPGSRGKIASAPYDYLTFVLDVAAVEGSGADAEEAALGKAEARNHTRQFREWTTSPVLFAGDAADVDYFEQARPGVVTMLVPRRKILVPGAEEDVNPETYDPKADPERKYDRELVSPGTKAKRDFGRDSRQRFYRRQIGNRTADDLLGGVGQPNSLGFTNHFDQLVDNPPPLSEMAISPQNKIAVVYADGNGFTGIRRRVSSRTFAGQLAPFRRRLLSSVLEWYSSNQDDERFVVIETKGDMRGHKALRLETLLWGGDELIFVMPSWLAFAFVQGFLNVTRNWIVEDKKLENGEQRLTHAIGVAIADRKTPIRQLTAVAREAADLVKEADLGAVDSVTFEIFESLAPPDTSLAAARKRVYGAEASPTDLARWLAIPGDHFGELLDDMFALTGKSETPDGKPIEGFARSQIYGALRAIRTSRAAGVADSLIDPTAIERSEKYLEDYSSRAGAEVTFLKERLPEEFPPPIGGSPRPLSIDLAMIAQFWDYANPLKAKLAPFGVKVGFG